MSASKGNPKPANRRRSAEQMRAAALEAGRALLVSSGPDGVTLKAVGAALGVTHANVLHHFGSAQLFHAALRDAMVTDLTDRMTALLARSGQAEPDIAVIVDETFDAYAKGGLGRLIAWMRLNEAGAIDERMAGSIARLMLVLRQRFGTETEPGLQVGLLSMLAFAASIMGGDLGRLVGVEPVAFRAMTVRLLDMLAHEQRNATPPDLGGFGDAAGPG